MMHRSSIFNRQGNQTGVKPDTVSFFSAFSNWRCGSNSLEDDFIHPTLISPSSTVQSESSCASQNDESRRQDDAINQFRSSGQHNADRNTAKSSSSSDPKNSANQNHFTEHSSEQDKFASNASCRAGRTTMPSRNSCQSNSVSLKKVNAIALCCDKCDGRHDTDSCPHYKKKRESHLDGQKNGWKLVGGSSNLPGAVIRMARVVPQAGDGSCLFHSLSFGIKDGSNACTLRKEICAYIQQHPQTPICETPLSEWVKWDSGVTCTEYARKMKNGAWGGGIEMACMSALKLCNVHVYEVKMGRYKRISAFDHPVTPELKKIVRVLYRGGVHYDALVTLV